MHLAFNYNLSYFQYILLSILVFLSLYNDLKSRIIPNWLTISMLFIGIIVNTINLGLLGLVHSILAIIMCFLIMIVPFIIGGLGGGDVKLVIAIGAIMGVKFTFYVIVFTAIIGALISLLILLRTKSFVKSLSKIWRYLTSTFLLKSLMTIDDEEHTSFPYGVAISIGVFVACILFKIKY